MTRRFSISLPNDVAAELDRVDNASAYIAEAIRQRRRRESTRAVLANAGYQVTDEGIARMRERVRALQARRAERDGTERLGTGHLATDHVETEQAE